MKIAGIQKMTLLDYPGKVACTVFLQGCGFRCPFCHNSDLLDCEADGSYDVSELLSFLRGRRGLLDAVCVTGGEPTLQPELDSLLAEIKSLGFLVKLDTNGSRPDVLRRVAEAQLVDYVAMDIKNSPARYGETVGIEDFKTDRIEESVRFLASGSVDYELRTTVIDELHSEQSILNMGQWLAHIAAPARIKRLFVQQFVDRDSVLTAGLHSPSEEKIRRFADILAPFADTVDLRGL